MSYFDKKVAELERIRDEAVAKFKAADEAWKRGEITDRAHALAREESAQAGQKLNRFINETSQDKMNRMSDDQRQRFDYIRDKRRIAKDTKDSLQRDLNELQDWLRRINDNRKAIEGAKDIRHKRWAESGSTAVIGSLPKEHLLAFEQQEREVNVEQSRHDREKARLEALLADASQEYDKWQTAYDELRQEIIRS